MTSHIFMLRRGYHLEPVDEASQERLAKVPERKAVEVTVIQRRNLEHHRLYFALLHRVADWLAQDDVTEDVLHEYAKLECGVVNLVRLADGSIQKLPGSTAFGAMGQVEFAEYFEKVVNLIYTKLQVPPKYIADLLLPKGTTEMRR